MKKKMEIMMKKLPFSAGVERVARLFTIDGKPYVLKTSLRTLFALTENGIRYSR